MPFAALVEMLFAPLTQGDEDGEQALALGGEHVFLIGRAIRCGMQLQDAGIHQLAQAVGEDVTGHAQAALEIAEAANTVECIAQDEQ